MRAAGLQSCFLEKVKTVLWHKGREHDLLETCLPKHLEGQFLMCCLSLPISAGSAVFMLVPQGSV